ncbi:MAG: 5-oxoprolinase subunit PxpB [Flavobacteriales bacterium]|nr:5-oxoprolinase subunit PxpB [Flavobacteriales bacterium]
MIERISAYGNSAMLIETGLEINRENNEKVQFIKSFLQNKQVEGIRALIPAYTSLCVVFDPLQTSFENLQSILSNILAEDISSKIQSRKLTIPVLYDHSTGPDLTLLMQENKLKLEEIIELHTQPSYQVFMMGFLAGFPYMGLSHTKLTTKRHSTPRKRVETGSVGLANNQTGIYPSASPGGWKIIGQCPVKLVREELETPFLFHAGDEVKFRAITKEEFEEIQKEEKNKTFDLSQIYA